MISALLQEVETGGCPGEPCLTLSQTPSHLAEVRGTVAPVADAVLEREDVREGPGGRGMPEHLQQLPRFAQAHAFRGVGLDCGEQGAGSEAAPLVSSFIHSYAGSRLESPFIPSVRSFTNSLACLATCSLTLTCCLVHVQMYSLIH